jgi:3',5'-cyclic AMP phosphodiesterase CpdA
MNSVSTRRRFLQQSFAFSAIAALGSLPARAKTLPSDKGASEILMIGDWGYEDTTGQALVAAGMRAYAGKIGLRPDALLLLGDNWYGPLEGGATSPRWQTGFESMYPASAFPGPAYAILGNHDYQNFPESKVDAELAYAATGKSRFIMPARWYRFEFPKANPLITFIALDSNMPRELSGKKPGRDFTLTAAQQAEQLVWLETELQRPRTTPYLVVMGHHPIYSDGPHGDHATLIRDWDPLFRKYGVHLYLAGHDHDLQHLEFAGHPTTHFLSGGGGADLYNLKIDPSQRGPFAQKVYGFSHLSVTANKLALRHLDSNGQTLHAFTKTPAGRIDILT